MRACPPTNPPKPPNSPPKKPVRANKCQVFRPLSMPPTRVASMPALGTCSSMAAPHHNREPAAKPERKPARGESRNNIEASPPASAVNHQGKPNQAEAPTNRTKKPDSDIFSMAKHQNFRVQKSCVLEHEHLSSRPILRTTSRSICPPPRYPPCCRNEDSRDCLTDRLDIRHGRKHCLAKKRPYATMAH